jgi:hypothetical protein
MIPLRVLYLRRPSLLLIIVLFSLQDVIAQTADTLPGRTFRPYDVYAAAGKFSRLPWLTSQEHFSKLAGKSSLIGLRLLDTGIVYLTSAPSNSITQGLYSPRPSVSHVYLQAGLTVKLRDNEDLDIDGPWLKMGISYFGNSAVMSGAVFKTTRRNTDSLYFLGGQAVHRDSVWLRALEYHYRHQSLNLEGTFYYQVNHKGIISLFGGAGLMAGINYGGDARVRYSEELAVYDTIDVAGGRSVLYEKTLEKTGTEERFNIGTSISAGVALSIGMNLRLANNYPFFRNLHAFAEYKPMFRIDVLPRLPVQSVVMSAYCAGLRYEFP